MTKKLVGVYLTQEELYKIDKIAAVTGTSRSATLRKFIREKITGFKELDLNPPEERPEVCPQCGYNVDEMDQKSLIVKDDGTVACLRGECGYRGRWKQ